MKGFEKVSKILARMIKQKKLGKTLYKKGSRKVVK